MIFTRMIHYKILDYCLEVIFDKVKKNFTIVNKRVILPKYLRVGMHISEISNTINSKVLKKCKILSLQPSDDTLHMVISFEEQYGVMTYGYNIISKTGPEWASPQDFIINIHNPHWDFYL